MASKIVTLTSDHGAFDPAIGIIKGKILSQNPEASIVDLHLEVTPFDISEAATYLKAVYKSFPKNTWHISDVFSQNDLLARVIATEINGQYFMSSDNGFIALMDEQITTAFSVKDYENMRWAEQAAELYHCIHNNKTEGLEKITISRRILKQPLSGDDYIRGAVINVDRYGNIITNITKEKFKEIRSDRQFKINFRRISPITILGNNYNEVPMGMAMCRFNQSGFLEIGINMENAAELLDVKINDIFQVIFTYDYENSYIEN